MKKYLLAFLMAIFLFSCSKKVEVQGKIVGGGSPLERVEIVEASGVGTLPLLNMGIGPNGVFTGSFEAPKNGMYLITYGGKQNLFYLKGGQKLEITGNAATFPNDFNITGDAKKNNDFLKETLKFMDTYGQKINMQEEMTKGDTQFVAFVKKTQADLEQNMDQAAKKTGADKEVVEWKKNDLKTILLTLLSQRTAFQMQTSGNAVAKPSKVLTDYEETLQKNKDELVREHPLYRQYLLNRLSPDVQTYAQTHQKNTSEETGSGMFANFLKTRKDLTDLEKEYLLAFVITSYDLNPAMTPAGRKQLAKVVEDNIKDAGIKKDLTHVIQTIGGFESGTPIEASGLSTIDGKSFSFDSQKGKPTLIVHYASWTPGLQEAALPVLQQVTNFYKSRFNFVYVNLDDTKEQAVKTSSSLLKDLPGTKVYADGGLNSEYAKKMGIYGFKLVPSYNILDKDGKFSGHTYYNAGDPEFVAEMDKLSGLKAPAPQPEATLQNDLLATPPPASPAPAPQPTK